MPDNAEYMFAAYVASAVVFAIYVASLMLRARAMTRRGDAIDTAPRT